MIHVTISTQSSESELLLYTAVLCAFWYRPFVYTILQDICQVLQKSLLQKEVNNELKSQWCNVWHWLSIVNIFKRVLHLQDRHKTLLYKPQRLFFYRGGIGGGPSQTNQLLTYFACKKKKNINSFFFFKMCVFLLLQRKRCCLIIIV